MASNSSLKDKTVTILIIFIVKCWNNWKCYPLSASAEVFLKCIQVILKQGV